MTGNNMDGKIAHDRNIWLGMEGSLLKELKEIPGAERFIEKLNFRLDGSQLHDIALDLIEEIESGKIQEDEKIKENVELITLIFAAIEDTQKELVKEMTGNPEEREEKNEKPLDQLKNEALNRPKKNPEIEKLKAVIIEFLKEWIRIIKELQRAGKYEEKDEGHEMEL